VTKVAHSLEDNGAEIKMTDGHSSIRHHSTLRADKQHHGQPFDYHGTSKPKTDKQSL
jgi:hypothetical protein